MSSPHTNRLGVEWFGLVMGLGFVLSFGYWCTDFLVVQRAMAADSMSAARRTPLIAALPKMFFPFLVILPGLIAMALPHPDLRDGVTASSRRRRLKEGPHPVKVDSRPGQATGTRTDGRFSITTSRSPTCCCTTSRPGFWVLA